MDESMYDAPHLARNAANFAALTPLNFLARAAAVYPDKIAVIDGARRFSWLEFDARCLEFHRTQRPIRTASSEQVRQPLYASGIGYWRRFERELQPLRNGLGDCLARFPEY